MAKKHINIILKEPMDELRSAAEKLLLSKNVLNDPRLSLMDISDLLHNVQVQQIELEMQNDELKTANEQLGVEKAHFAGLFDAAPVGYFILNHLGVIEQVNSTGLQLFGMGNKIIKGKRFQSLIAAPQWGVFSVFLQRLKKEKGKQICQLSISLTEHTAMHLQIQGTATQAAFSDNNRFYLAVIDITDRQNASLQLTQLNERLNLALSASLAGTWEINLKTGLIFLDDFSKKILGFDDGNFSGLKECFLKIIHPEDRGYVAEQLQLALTFRKKLDIDYRIIRRSGNVCFVGVRGHVVELDNGLNNFVGLITNIDQKKNDESEAQQQKITQHKNIIAATLHAQENERKRISESLHDSVSQLLYSIKLNLNHYQADASSLARANQLLDMAIQDTRNISFELAPSILTDFGLAVTIEELCRRLSVPHLTITFKTGNLKERLSQTMEINIYRVIQELVNNAIKHASATIVTINVKKEAHKIVISVEDNGKGFTKESPDKKVLGTGLASIKNRVNLFNGTIDIKSELNKGSRILVAFDLLAG